MTFALANLEKSFLLPHNPLQHRFKPMKTFLTQHSSHRRTKAFTLVEMLVVIAIMSILVTAGAVGLSGIGGKGVTTGVATSEALFDEARSTAVGRNLRSCVLVAKTLTNNPAEDLRRIVIAYEETEQNKNSPNFGQAKNPSNPSPKWELSSRGALLPEKTFFSSRFSKKDRSGGSLDEIESKDILGAKPPFEGRYFIYQFNNQGILSVSGTGNYEGGASFIIGSGARNSARSSTAEPPRTVSEAKMDFGGFVIWRSGRTSVYRSPEQMNIPSSVREF